MVSLQLATVVPASRKPSPPNINILSLYSTKACSSSAGNRTVEGPTAGCFSSPQRPIPKACLAAVPVSVETEVDVDAAVGEGQGMPKHIAVIMDGSGRWARKRNLPVRQGHQAGSRNLTALISNCCDLGIMALTIFAFSEENWKRPQMEIDFLMRAIENYIRTDLTKLITRYNTRFSMIGNKSKLPEYLQSSISWAEEMSQGNKGMQLVMAASYSGRNDVVTAAREMATKVERGILRAADINEAMFEQELMTKTLEFPNPDLVIRTSGEIRISNFLLWQSAYSEFYFADKLFPDFAKDDLLRAIDSYRRRQRRFGERMN